MLGSASCASHAPAPNTGCESVSRLIVRSAAGGVGGLSVTCPAHLQGSQSQIATQGDVVSRVLT